MNEIVEALKLYGHHGVTALFAIAVVVLYRDNRKIQEARVTEMQVVTRAAEALTREADRLARKDDRH